MFKGVFVAIVTPFKNGKIDEEALRGLIDYQISEGIYGIVPCGTTGESATLNHAEHEQVIRIAVDACKGKASVLAGTGSNSTQEAIELSRNAEKAGADGLLQITPYYNKPTQAGLFQHYKVIAETVNIPQILYNEPGRTACDMLPETIIQLASIDNIIGVKEATADLSRVKEIRESTHDDFLLLSGDDETTKDFILTGGDGVISVTANVAPK